MRLFPDTSLHFSPEEQQRTVLRVSPTTFYQTAHTKGEKFENLQDFFIHCSVGQCPYQTNEMRSSRPRFGCFPH